MISLTTEMIMLLWNLAMWISGVAILAEVSNALSVVLLTMTALCQPSNTTINNQVDLGRLLLLRFIWIYLVFSFLIVLSASFWFYILIYLQQERLSQKMLIHDTLISIGVKRNQKTWLSVLMMSVNFSKKTCSGVQKQNGAGHSYRY